LSIRDCRIGSDGERLLATGCCELPREKPVACAPNQRQAQWHAIA
jgi:hypothetical protein